MTYRLRNGKHLCLEPDERCQSLFEFGIWLTNRSILREVLYGIEKQRPRWKKVLQATNGSFKRSPGRNFCG
jgi:predicted metalloendopeptidase